MRAAPNPSIERQTPASRCLPLISNLRCFMATRTILFLLSAPNVALGYDADRARTNFAHELAECAAYYQFVSEAPRLDDPTKQNSLEVSNSLMLLSADLTSQELSLARFELALKTMVLEIDFNWENLSILLNKYAYPCKDAAEDPKARLKYWLKKND